MYPLPRECPSRDWPAPKQSWRVLQCCFTLDRDGPGMSNVMRLDSSLPRVGSSAAGGFQCWRPDPQGSGRRSFLGERLSTSAPRSENTHAVGGVRLSRGSSWAGADTGLLGWFTTETRTRDPAGPSHYLLAKGGPGRSERVSFIGSSCGIVARLATGYPVTLGARSAEAVATSIAASTLAWNARAWSRLLRRSVREGRFRVGRLRPGSATPPHQVSQQFAPASWPGDRCAYRCTTSLHLRPSRVHGIGEANERHGRALNGTADSTLPFIFRFLAPRLRIPSADRERGAAWCAPQYPRTLGVGRRGAGEQEERDEQWDPSSESHHRLSSSAVARFTRTQAVLARLGP